MKEKTRKPFMRVRFEDPYGVFHYHVGMPEEIIEVRRLQDGHKYSFVWKRSYCGWKEAGKPPPKSVLYKLVSMIKC